MRGNAGFTDGSGTVELWWPTSRGKGPIPVFVGAMVQDRYEVWWRAERRLTLRRPPTRADFDGPVDSLHVELQRGYQRKGPLFIDPEATHSLEGDTQGRFVLADFAEYCDALNLGLPTAATSLAGKVIEGAIRRRAELDSWWDEAWEELPLGKLVDQPAVRDHVVKDFGRGFYGKVKLPVLRNTAIHQKWVVTTMSEAAGTSSVVLDLLNRWGASPKPPTRPEQPALAKSGRVAP
jgi:hypothetical protein